MTLPDFLTQDADGFIRLTGHRIGLHHVVRLSKEGYTPEMLVEHYPTLGLGLIRQVLTFYFEHQPEVDAIVAREQADYEQRAAEPAQGPSLAELRRRIEAKRRAEAG